MGLFDNLNQAIGQGMSSPLFALGTGLIAGAQPFANPGQQLQSAAANQQKLAMNNMQMRMLQQQWPMMMQAFGALGGLMGPPSGSKTSQKTQSKANAAPVVGPFSAVPAAQGAPQAAPQPQQAAPSGGLDPSALERFGLMTSAFPMTKGMSDAALKVAGMQSQYDPALQTRLAIAKSVLTQDQQMMADAQAKGDTLGFRAAQMKYLKDSGLVTQSSMNGAVQTFGGITPDMLKMTTLNPVQGVQTRNGQETPIPGAVPTEAALSGARAAGEAQFEPMEVTDGNGNKYMVPRTALQQYAASGKGGATPFQASLGPASEELLKGKGEQAASVNEEFQQKAEAGQQMLAQIAELRSAASDFSPGQFADSRIKMLQYMQSAGLISPEQMKKLGSAQAGQKIAIQLQAAATKQLGSREAAQIFQVMGKSLPNLTLSPDGLSKVSGYMSGIARYDIARAQIAQYRMANNDANGLNAVRDDFIKNTNPTYYIIGSMPAAQQQEMIKGMGPRAKGFLEAWNKAANAGWAPRPNQYASQ